MKKRRTNVLYNYNDHPIFIACSIKADPMGLVGEMESKHVIMPGHGIDISVIGLLPHKPEPGKPSKWIK